MRLVQFRHFLPYPNINTGLRPLPGARSKPGLKPHACSRIMSRVSSAPAGNRDEPVGTERKSIEEPWPTSN